jgi:hypothetical protein
LSDLFSKKDCETKKSMTEHIFLDKNDCIRLFSGKEILVFGTGVDGEQVEKELSESIHISAYIDNYRSGEGHLFYGKDIICLKQYLSQNYERKIILIASYRYAMEICKQLSDHNLLQGIDFFVWDDMYLFHYDNITKDYINFLSCIWKKHKKSDDSKKILVPFDNRHDLMSIIYAYCANYFAEKYDAVIYGYIRYGSSYSNSSNVIKSIYNAFNVKSLINVKLSDKQLSEAEEICENVWSKLETWEDWKNITIYGICFGTTIIRDFLRVYVPDFDLKDKKMYQFLKKTVKTIVFWYNYIYENDIKVVLLADGVTWDGYIRDIAITKGIPTYALCYKMAKMNLDFHDASMYPHFKDMWNQLTVEEQKFGLQWAKKHLGKRLQGGMDEIFSINRINFPFSESKKNVRVLDDNNKIKIIICPHVFEEDCYYCGEQIFDNNYFAWLCHLGELAEKTPNYDWYLKMHPSAKRRDFIIIDMLLKKYPQIRRIPSNISPLQLKEEGAKFALTVYGSIGHEYPEIGIEVINAGINPHCAFDFTWNPKTKEEYDDLIFNLEHLKRKNDKEGLLQFYSLNYLFYNKDYIPYRKLFFKNPLLAMNQLELQAIGKKLGTWKYKEYMEEWTIENHELIFEQMENVFQKLDQWDPTILYRKKDNSNESVISYLENI